MPDQRARAIPATHTHTHTHTQHTHNLTHTPRRRADVWAVGTRGAPPYPPSRAQAKFWDDKLFPNFEGSVFDFILLYFYTQYQPKKKRSAFLLRPHSQSSLKFSPHRVPLPPTKIL